MDDRNVIITALNGYLVEVQSDEHHYGDYKKEIILSYLSYIREDGIISNEWLMNKTIINEALKLYKKTLVDERNVDSSYSVEYRIVNNLIRKTESI